VIVERGGDATRVTQQWTQLLYCPLLFSRCSPSWSRRRCSKARRPRRTSRTRAVTSAGEEVVRPEDRRSPRRR
ncbi:hypothetical protein XENOCAPTIV_014369, partial [Xenoophorus captivus]